MDKHTSKTQQTASQTSDQSGDPEVKVPAKQTDKTSTDLLNTPFPDMTPTQIMTRQFLVSSFSVGASFGGATVSFPKDLLPFKSLECGCASFRWFRAGVRVTVKIQSTLSQAGLMCVSWLPCTSPEAIQSSAQTGNNAYLLNFSSQDTVTFDIPWLNPSSWSSTTDEYSIGTVYFTMLVGYRGPTTTSDFVDVQVYAQYLKPELTGPIVAQSSEPYQRGIVSTVAEPVFQFMDAVENGVSAVSGLLGMLDKPDAPTNTRHVNTIVPDTNSFISSDTVVSSVPYSVNTPHLLPNRYNLFPYGHSSNTMTGLVARPMIHSVKTITSKNDSLTVDMNPFLPPTFESKVSPDYLSYFANRCRFFRGSQKFLLYFVTDAYTSCRVRIGITMGTVSDSEVDSGDTISRVVDVKGSTMCSILVPYLCPTPWATAQSYYPNFYAIAITDPVGAALPSEATITLVVFRAGGPDTQFAYPSQYELTSLTKNRKTAKVEVPTDLVAQCSLNDHFKTSFTPIMEGVKIGKEYGSSVANVCSSPSQFLKTVPREPNADNTIHDFPLNTKHYFLESMTQVFMFWRGSTRLYHTALDPVSSTGAGISTAMPTYITSPDLFTEDALAAIPFRSPSQIDGVHITLPWYSTCPYLPLISPNVDQYDRVVFDYPKPTARPGQYYLYPGDDFVLGHLRNPTPFAPV